jgi:PAS domain S-box-containing protein
VHEEVDSSSLQNLLENALDPIIVAIGDTPVFANAPALALTGYDHDELLHLTVSDLIHPDDRDMIEDLQRASLPDVPAPGPFHTVLVCRDQSIHPVEITPLKTLWQGRGASILILRDTSQRAEEIAHLREIEQNLRFLIENTNDGIIVVSEEGRFVWVNRQVSGWLGHSTDELAGRPFRDIIHPDEMAVVTERFANRIAGRPAPRRYETRVVTRGGQVIPVEITAVAATWRGHLADVIIVRDLIAEKASAERLRAEQNLTDRLRAEVEERQRMEQALRASEELFRDVAQASGEYIWQTDTSGELTFVSDRVTAILGYTPEELLGRGSWEFTYPQESAQVFSRLAALTEDARGPITREQCVRARDGRIVWLQVHILTVRDNTGRLVGYRGTCLDTTEQRQSREALHRRDAILEAVSFAAERLIHAERWSQDIEIVLERLGQAAGADRVGLYQLHRDENGELCASRRHSWTRLPGPGGSEDAAAQSIPLLSFFPESWVERQARGESMLFTAEEAPERLRGLLENLGARVVLSQPVMVDGQIWGMLSYSNVAKGILWQPQERDALRAAADILGDVLRRQAAEESLKRKDEILEAVSFAAERLLGSRNWEESIEEILAHLARAAGVSRVVLQEIRSAPDGEYVLRWLYGWASPEWPFDLRIRARQGIPILSSGYEEVLKALRRGQAQVIPPPGASPEIQNVVRRFGVVSVLSVPILVKGKLWGVFGFTQCGTNRNWSGPESDALRAAADVLGVIMERQGAEEALRESEEKYRSLVEGVEQVIAVIDRSGVFQFANRRAQLDLGLADGEIIGSTMWNLFPKEYADRQMTAINRTLDSGEPSIAQSRVEVGGRLRWYETRLQPLHVPDGGSERIQLVATDITEYKEIEARLLTYQERLRSLTSELALTEQRERRRIAAELHDRIGQTLALTKIKLGQLRGVTSALARQEGIDELRGLVDQTIRDTRSLTFELSPPILYELGLEPALAWLVERFRDQHGIVAVFRDDGRTKPLGADLQGLLFQATQELLVNVVKHAAAKKALVILERHGNEIWIEVSDDGAGFDPSTLVPGAMGVDLPSGFGLFSIRERLGHLGGRLEITSQIGRGTTAVLQAPLLEDQAEQTGGDRP